LLALCCAAASLLLCCIICVLSLLLAALSLLLVGLAVRALGVVTPSACLVNTNCNLMCCPPTPELKMSFHMSCQQLFAFTECLTIRVASCCLMFYGEIAGIVLSTHLRRGAQRKGSSQPERIKSSLAYEHNPSDSSTWTNHRTITGSRRL
jgi:hypothetical protein